MYRFVWVSMLLEVVLSKHTDFSVFYFCLSLRFLKTTIIGIHASTLVDMLQTGFS